MGIFENFVFDLLNDKKKLNWREFHFLGINKRMCDRVSESQRSDVMIKVKGKAQQYCIFMTDNVRIFLYIILFS
jgi:hypothetical protein